MRKSQVRIVGVKFPVIYDSKNTAIVILWIILVEDPKRVSYPHEVVTVSQGLDVRRSGVVLFGELNHGRDELNQPVAPLPVVVPQWPVRIIHRGRGEELIRG
jgi:hypothetical protein